VVRAVRRPDRTAGWAHAQDTAEAAAYITELPKAEHDAAEWQTAMETLLLVAERDGPEMMARIGMMQALNRHGAKVTPAPRQKRAKAYRVIR
jgi:hypothetical protein